MNLKKLSSSTVYFIAGWVFCLLLGVSLRVYLCASQSLWFDEVYGTKIFLSDFWATVFTSLRQEHVPGLFILLGFWVKCFGDSDFIFRFPNLVASLASIYLFFLIASKGWGKQNAYLATLLLLMSPVHLYHSAEVRCYSLGIFFLLLQIWAYWKYMESQENLKSKGWMWLYFFSAICSGMIFTYLGIYTLLIGVFSFFQLKKQKMAIWWVSQAVLLLLFIYLCFKSQIAPFPKGLSYLRKFNLFELWMLWFNWFALGNTLFPVWPYHAKWASILSRPILLSTQIITALIFIKGGVDLLRNKQKNYKNIELVAYIMILPACLFFANFFGYKQYYIERSAIFGLPFFYIVIACGVFSLKNNIIRRALYIFLTVLSFFSTTLFIVRDGEWTVYKPKPDFRSCTRYLQEEQGKSIKPITVVSGYCVMELAHYDPCFDTQVRIDILSRTGRDIYAWSKKNYGIKSQLAQAIEARLKKGFALKCSDEPKKPFMAGGYVPDLNRSEFIYYVQIVSWPQSDNELLSKIRAYKTIRSMGTVGFKDLVVYKFINRYTKSTVIA